MPARDLSWKKLFVPALEKARWKAYAGLEITEDLRKKALRFEGPIGPPKSHWSIRPFGDGKLMVLYCSGAMSGSVVLQVGDWILCSVNLLGGYTYEKTVAADQLRSEYEIIQPDDFASSGPDVSVLHDVLVRLQKLEVLTRKLNRKIAICLKTK